MKYEIVRPFAWYKKGQVVDVDENHPQTHWLENIGMIRKVKEG